MPEVHSSKLSDGSEFLILACDGIWEVLSDQEVRISPLSYTCAGCLVLMPKRAPWLPISKASSTTTGFEQQKLAETAPKPGKSQQ